MRTAGRLDLTTPVPEAVTLEHNPDPGREEPHLIQNVPVSTKRNIADFASWAGFSLFGVTAAFRILPYEYNRQRANILVVQVTAFPGVILGKEKQVESFAAQTPLPTVPVGNVFLLPPGASFRYEANEELFAFPLAPTAGAWLSVEQERWRDVNSPD